MNKIRKHGFSRFLGYLLTLALMLPSLLSLSPAWAQIGSAAPVARTTSQQVISVAVLDFANKTGVGGALLGRKAADAVVNVMTASEKFDVTPRDQVQREMTNLGYSLPLDRNSMSRLGTNLGVSSFIIGEVIAAKPAERNKPAEATITVQMIDAASGEAVNGATSAGDSGSKVDYTGDPELLMDQALSDAATSAIKSMTDYLLPEATVLMLQGTNEVLLNRGATSGIANGMEMLILRNGEKVGRVRVTVVTPTDSTATILENNRGIATQDKARAIFRLPVVTGKTAVGKARTESSRPRGKSGWNVGKLLLAALLVIGVTKIANTSGGGANTPEGGETAKNVTAIPTTRNGAPVVVVSWKPPALVGRESLIEYHIWRSDRPRDDNGHEVPVGVVRGSREFIDTTAPRAVTFAQILPENTDPTGGSSDLNVVNITDPLVPGVVPGTTYTYEVTFVYQKQELSSDGGTGGGGGSGTTDTLYFETPRQPLTGRVTPVSPPAIVSPPNFPDQGSESVSLNPLTVEWTTVNGATQYQVFLSTDPDFKQNVVASAIIPSTQQVEGTPIRYTFPASLNLAQRFGNQIIYWRVGARNHLDTVKPIAEPPVPNITGGASWVLSRVQSFQGQELPPPTP
ncbi:MAG: hypothetical protein IT210_03290 [Armatimonadetes bacterium]|nr:hypothetical protein [Armatimonadota bacterium]